MPKKPKFKPVITWVKLNPEQAVLNCNCRTHSLRFNTMDYYNNGSSFETCYGPGGKGLTLGNSEGGCRPLGGAITGGIGGAVAAS